MRTSCLVAARLSGALAAMRSGEPEGHVEDLIGSHHRVDQSQGEGPFGVDGFPREGHLQGHAQGQPLGHVHDAAARRTGPRFTSGSPKDASDDATTTSQPISSSKPAATALALAAPMTGTSTWPATSRR